MFFMFTELYHATFKCYLDSILFNGLGGKEANSHPNWYGSLENVVCMATVGDLCVDMCEASPMASDEVYNSGIVLLAIDVKGLELEHDPNIFAPDDTNYWIYRGIIPPERIQVVEELLP